MASLRDSELDYGSGTSLGEREALLLIQKSVRKSAGLIEGKLNGKGGHCALGCFWEDNPDAGLTDEVINDVAAVNDAVPKTATRKTRREFVLNWLRLKLKNLTVTP